jgi:molybdate transport system substrate-binding protein
VSGSITVLAAASLSEAFPAVADAFEDANPGAEVRFSFAGSSTLATQVREGAPADVFASADTRTMEPLVTEGLAGEPVVFATNRLAIIVEPGNPKGITSLADLAADDVLYVTAAPEVPIARYAQDALTAAGVAVTPVSQEADVKGIVTKVTTGEADAGIVYATDVVAAGDDAEGVPLSDLEVVATYPAAVLADAADPDVAEAFLAFLVSEEGQAILAEHGFGPA